MAKKPAPPEHPEVGDPSVPVPEPFRGPKPPDMKSRIRRAKVEDPRADVFFRKAQEAAEEADGDVERYLALGPALPSWHRPSGVVREVLGRFLLDRDTHLVHDCEHAVEACDIDAIANGTWFHFWLEVPDDAGDPHPECIPE